MSWSSARLVYDKLKRRQVDVFMDLQNLGSGTFDDALLREIEQRPYFLIVLQPGSLDRCVEPGDWLLRELDHAWKTKRTIIPLWMQGFDDADIDKFLPETLAREFRRFNAVPVSDIHFDDAMKRLTREFLKPLPKPQTIDDENSSKSPTRTEKKLVSNTRTRVQNNTVSTKKESTSLSLKLVTEYELPKSHDPKRISVLRYSPDGKYLFAGLNKDQIAVWETSTGKLININSPEDSARLSRGMDWSTHCIAISPDGTLLATTTYSHAVQIWIADTLQSLRTVGTFNYPPISLDFSPDRKWLIAGLDDEYIQSWSLDDNFRSVDRVRAHQKRIEAVKFRPKSLNFASCGIDGRVRYWQIVEEEIRELGTFEGNDQKHVVDIAFSPNGRFLASGSVSGQICLWEVKTGKLLREMRHEAHIRVLAFSPDNRLLVSGSNDKTLKIWSVTDGQKLISKKFDHSVSVLEISPDGQFLTVSGEANNTAQIWQIQVHTK